MGRIVAVEYLTLDGVFENPGWTQPYFDDAVAAFQAEAMQWADALLLGRVTYDGMSEAWPAIGNDPSTGGDIMNSIGKYVPTSTLTEPTWNARFLEGDVVDGVTGLKAGSENLVVYGSGRLTETLRAAGLIDEYRLLICPIVLGEGRKLFTGPAPSKFTVANSSTAPSGMALLTLVTV
jgi:dihydrofolate reductase